MSVTGHLFGAHEFDELYEMYKYTLKICVITTIVVMIAFIILRDYAFSLFSITGMQTEILWIAILGTVIMNCFFKNVGRFWKKYVFTVFHFHKTLCAMRRNICIEYAGHQPLRPYWSNCFRGAVCDYILCILKIFIQEF